MLSLSKYLKAYWFVASMLLFKNIAFFQNLIQNPSFELYSNSIECANGGFDNISTWPPLHVVDNWYSFNSPDYFHPTCNPSWYNVPHSYFGDSYAKTALAYVGFSVYNRNFEKKEYIYQQLAAPLIHDSTYCLSFFTTRSDRSLYAIKTLGAYLSTNMPTMITNYYISASPQIINTSGFLTDTVNWVELQGCFVALGGEQYLTIGNFNSNANTDTLRVQPVNPFPPNQGDEFAYYYIDSVSLWKNNIPTGINYLEQESNIRVYPNPASERINIKYEVAVDKENVQIIITDVIGRKIIISDYREQLDVSTLDDGIYLITLLKDRHPITTKKFIKKHI